MNAKEDDSELSAIARCFILNLSSLLIFPIQTLFALHVSDIDNYQLTNFSYLGKALEVLVEVYLVDLSSGRWEM